MAQGTPPGLGDKEPLASRPFWFLGISLSLGAIPSLALLAQPRTWMIPAVQYASAAWGIIGILVIGIINVIGGPPVPMS